jgi:hypothetical protein
MQLMLSALLALTAPIISAYKLNNCIHLQKKRKKKKIMHICMGHVMFVSALPVHRATVASSSSFPCICSPIVS